MAVGSDYESGYEYSDESGSEEDSDTELQRKFASGELKPGLHHLKNKPSRVFVNNVDGLQQKLGQLYLQLPWVERFDVVSEPAPMAPELDAEIEEHGQRRLKNMKFKNIEFTLEDDPIHNDFKREMTFYRQAQATVMDAYSRLKDLSLPTNRPDDYFAQMAKSDEHMQKVRRRLQNKQVGQQLSEHVKKIREIKKYGKKVQIEAEQEKQKAKREMLQKIKKFRKGKTDTIDFLEDKKGPLRKGDSKAKAHMKKDKRIKGKRAYKDLKFGFGGKKKNSKRNNTKETRDAMPSVKRFGTNQGKGRKAGMSKGNRNKKFRSKR